MPGAMKEFMGKGKGKEVKCQEQGKKLAKRDGNRSEVPGAGKKYRGKEMGTEAKCQEKRKRLAEKRGELKQTARSKEIT
jgi:hypothetical protein